MGSPDQVKNEAPIPKQSPLRPSMVGNEVVTCQDKMHQYPRVNLTRHEMRRCMFKQKKNSRFYKKLNAQHAQGCISGMFFLVLSNGKSSHTLRFNEDLFFIYLLPPIIFNAGFQVKKKQCFQNFITIMLCGVVGVFISAFIIVAGSRWFFPRLGFLGLTARDHLAAGAIFSSNDTVCTLQVLRQDETPLLYSLVFGEVVVNDATSVVLFNAIQKMDSTRLNSMKTLRIIGDFFYLFLASTALGITTGLVIAYILKTLYFVRHSSSREISLMVLMAYLSYMLAELLELSGILTVFFCGILMSHYAWHNVTESSRITTRYVFAMMPYVAETFIFLYVGMDALDIEKWKTSKLRCLVF
ncbi:hypothetical protein GH714_007197 [Hevea brasiliensis]|uniref:Cation/H+ exchanger transmembrane domain-containing protein n=1 Tax=Hevea brasiliensis TaxID=3981 RepID=A0A6A6KJ88_HEVBR|nr:hypothetical protein GH714_007197 [Hevea brasiliensis]